VSALTRKRQGKGGYRPFEKKGALDEKRRQQNPSMGVGGGEGVPTYARGAGWVRILKITEFGK